MDILAILVIVNKTMQFNTDVTINFLSVIDPPSNDISLQSEEWSYIANEVDMHETVMIT